MKIKDLVEASRPNPADLINGLAKKHPFVIVAQSVAWSQRGNGMASLNGAVESFDSLRGLVDFLKKFDVEVHDTEIGQGDLSPEKWINLPEVISSYRDGDVDGDNYNWITMVFNGKKEPWYDSVIELLDDAAELDDDE